VRVLVRTRTDGNLCNNPDSWVCTASITRFIWAGDQILWELRAPGNGGTGANLEATDGGGNAYGRVSHSYAGGIDRPLVITKLAVATVVPHQNWRGMFATATLPNGVVSEVAVNWPGFETTPWHKAASLKPNWFGSVATGMRDASGQIYMRNRYYNPATGQFTQPDPIGLAGGLNSYGFAAGDPVSYADPFGLKVCYQGNRAQVSALRAATEEATGAAVYLDKDNCVSGVGNSMNRGLRGLRNRLVLLASLEIVYNVSFGTRGAGDHESALSGEGNVTQSYITRHCPALVCPVNIWIASGWATGYRSTDILGMCMPWRGSRNTLGQQIAHELLGHGFEYYAYGAAATHARSEMATIRGADNVFLAATGQRPRCAH
jgi:RHS repeat-associated protein